MSAGRFSFPKSARLLSSAEYRRIYEEGRKFAGPLFAAFYRPAGAGKASRVGYTTPKAIGPAVTRNRVRRRLREAVRLELPTLGRGWEIVFNPRRTVAEAEFLRLRSEVCRLFERLGKSS